MLLQRHRHPLLFSAVLLAFIFCVVLYSNVDIKSARSGLISHWKNGDWTSAEDHLPHTSDTWPASDSSDTLLDSDSNSHDIDHSDLSQFDSSLTSSDLPKPHGNHEHALAEPSLTAFASNTHHEIFSQSTDDGRYFFIKFRDNRAMNPNIIPHPTRQDVWFIVAQQYKTVEQNSQWFVELVCEATFQDGDIQCLEPPKILPITSMSSSHCTGDYDYYDMSIGPHDARVFQGPDHPYIIYGSQSQHSCFGLWMQDFRRLVDWRHDYQQAYAFRQATDLQRPAPYAPVEKNWFVFWDWDEQIYAHYDVHPKRVFARLNADGSSGENLAYLAKEHDSRCMERFLGSELAKSPKFHQATNSLSITMCAQADLACEKTADKTFIFTVFQKKTEIKFHSVYEPYVMLSKQTSPFEIHAISTKPIWIHGRRVPDEQKVYIDVNPPLDQSEMLYVTSMSWKDSSRRYHGYLDDVIFLAFGIEDSQAGAIDVLASDLLAQIGICDTV